MSNDEYMLGAELLKALGHPIRLSIVDELSRHDRCVHELVGTTCAEQPAVSQHLQVLRAARLIVGTKVGREVRYRLADDHVALIVKNALAHGNEGAKQTTASPRPLKKAVKKS